VVFVAIHVFGLWADNFVYFGWRELFIPMRSPWKTGAVAWGVVAFYLLAAIQVTSWLMRHIKRRIWHAVHLTSIALWLSATVHHVPRRPGPAQHATPVVRLRLDDAGPAVDAVPAVHGTQRREVGAAPGDTGERVRSGATG
jgi:hypothetical protein